MFYKAENIFYLSLYRKMFADPCFVTWLEELELNNGIYTEGILFSMVRWPYILIVPISRVKEIPKAVRKVLYVYSYNGCLKFRLEGRNARQ